MTENKTKNKYSNPVISVLTGIQALFTSGKPDIFLKPDDRLDGKTVLVDGSSSGLGFAIAADVARRGAKVIMACRSGIPEKGEMVKKLSGNQDITMLQVDFSDVNSIHHLVSCILHLETPIDIVIINAAVVPGKSRKTKQGLEEMFMVNYLSKFIFINLLLETGCVRLSADGIRLSAFGSQKSTDGNRPSENNYQHPESSIQHQVSGNKSRMPNAECRMPRIIIVSSESHRNPQAFDWEGFGIYKEYGMKKVVELYGYYKLLLTTFAKELSQRLNPDGKTNISVFSLCPGPINTNIAREAPALFQPLMKLVFALFFRPADKAAVPVIYLAASKEMEGKPFDYLFRLNRKEISELAEDPENGKRLWEMSEKLIEAMGNRQ